MSGFISVVHCGRGRDFLLCQQLLAPQLFYLLGGELQFTRVVRGKNFRSFTVFRCRKIARRKVGEFVLPVKCRVMFYVTLCTTTVWTASVWWLWWAGTGRQWGVCDSESDWSDDGDCRPRTLAQTSPAWTAHWHCAISRPPGMQPLPSMWQQSYGDCLEVKREYYQNCFILSTCYLFNEHS